MFQVELLAVGLVQGAMYAMMALGLTLVYGLLRILHIAHAALFTLGAYAGVTAANSGLPILAAVALAIIVGAIAGPLVYLFIYKPLLPKPPYVALIASIGLLIALEDSFRLIFGPYGLSFDHNPWFVAGWNFGGIYLNAIQITIGVCAIVLIGALAYFASHTRMGVAWRATVTDPAMAETFGVNPNTIRIMNFAIASILAAIAGVLVALLNNLVEPGMGAIISYKGLAIIVLGGLGNVPGTLAAALLLGVVESFGQTYLDHFLDRDAIAFLVLIVVLMVRPQGLFSRGQ